MDVVAPKPTAPEPVKAAPQQAVDLPVAEPESATKKPKPAEKAPVAKPPKAPKNGVGLAVFATIVIVLGLGALMVYAYLRTNGVNPL